jgi:hypothetical protein
VASSTASRTQATALSDAGERVRWLLRTWHDVRQGGYGAESTGAGTIMMPSDWACYSYPELERQLWEMRDNGARRLWWHTVSRYRDARRLALDVPVRRSRLGAVPVLPPHCELVGGAVFSGAKRACVLVRRWPENVRPELADAGVRRLVELMYRGDRQRIQLPPAVAALLD